MLSSVHRHIIHQALSKSLLLDLEDRIVAEAYKASEMVRERSGLGKKRARELEGQARFRMMEQGYEEVCAKHGGKLLDSSVVSTKNLKIFQPFTRFEVEGKGVILGLAAMPDRKTLPTKNKSRLAGVTLNYQLSPRLDLDGKSPQIGDIFVLLLVSRHREKAGKIDEIAIGVIDSDYKSFLFYETLEEFISYSEMDSTPAQMPSTPRKQQIKIKKNVIPFAPPEPPGQQEDNKKSTKRQ